MVASPNRKMRRVLQFSMASTLTYVLATFYFGVRARSSRSSPEAGHNVPASISLPSCFPSAAVCSKPSRHRRENLWLPARRRPRRLRQRPHPHRARRLDRPFRHPSPVHPGRRPATRASLMVVAAFAGVLMNGVIAALLWKSSGDVNIRSVFLHMLGDTLSTAAVIAGQFCHRDYRRNVARSCPLSPHRRHDRLEFHHHRARDPQHPPRRNAPHPPARRHPHRSRRRPWRPRHPRPALLVPRLLIPRARQSHHHPGDALSECSSILDAINCTLRDRFRITTPPSQFEIRGCPGPTSGCSAPPPSKPPTPMTTTTATPTPTSSGAT